MSPHDGGGAADSRRELLGSESASESEASAAGAGLSRVWYGGAAGRQMAPATTLPHRPSHLKTPLAG